MVSNKYRIIKSFSGILLDIEMNRLLIYIYIECSLDEVVWGNRVEGFEN